MRKFHAALGIAIICLSLIISSSAYTPFIYIDKIACHENPVNTAVNVCYKEVVHSNKSVQQPYCETVPKLAYFETVCEPVGVIGIRVDGGAEFIGDNFNVFKDTLCVWKFPVMDRNFKEYPCCSEVELKKGACGVKPLWDVKNSEAYASW